MQNQFKIAFRNLKKNKSFSLINIFGLSLGMACCFLTILYCWHEFNYDDFYKDGDQLYRVEYTINRGEARRMGRIPPTIGPLLVDNFPEIEAVSRFYPRELSVELPERQRQFEMEDVFFVDSTVVDLFEFDFLHGNANTALHRPEAVVITDVTAKKIFGKTDVLGESLRLAGEDGYRISGVVKAWPDNSHLAFTILLPYETMFKVEPPHARESIKKFTEMNWTATHSYTYVKLKPNQDPQKVDERFVVFIAERGNERMRSMQTFTLFPINKIHLYTDAGGPKHSGNLSYLYLFFSIGLLTLFIACINFINLSTASSMTRAKEVGVRKVLGAQRSALIGQFLGESMLLSLFSFLISLLITLLALPSLNSLTGIEIPIMALFNPLLLLVFLGIFLLTGILAGLYPAFFVSRFQPAKVLKGVGGGSSKAWNQWLRKGLITLQFLAAIGFIAGAVTIYMQIQFLSNQPLGFNQDLVVSVPLDSGNNLNSVLRPGDAGLRKRMNTFDESLLENPKIKAVTQCSKLPGLGTLSRHVASEQVPEDENMTSKVLSVDYDFYETFEYELLAGRDFDVSFGTDHIDAFILNEKGIKQLGFKDAASAVGQPMSMEGKEGKIIGVAKDFHFENLRDEIQPLLMDVRPGAFGFFAMRIENSNIRETLSFVESKWKTAFPEKGFEYTFLDESISESYEQERRLSSIITYFAMLAIFIACFGLFGLAALLTQQRFKEIGIRKVLGASVPQILQLISKDFIKLIGLAMLLATPLCWYFLSDWLTGFAYRIEFPWWATLVSGLAVMILAFFTISAQSVKAALSNPVDAIRDE